eukprot:SAG31_NODE_22924_length_515_cov_0.853365_2_plen_30_part_01
MAEVAEANTINASTKSDLKTHLESLITPM